MIQFCCDRCRRILDPTVDARYVVKIEAQAALDPTEFFADQEERDHLTEIEQMLDGAEESGLPTLPDDAFQQFRYDLCGECFQRYIQNPLGSETPAQMGFSPN